MSIAYYNEFDPFAAAWLMQLIAAGHIAPGVVDTRSIEDVTPNDLRGFTQCHFFAGIGIWSLAARGAGYGDDEPFWTGSCPCQPFSAAGKGGGFDDERHLWPAWQWLIAQCRPELVAGEQVASSNVDPWLDLVQADLEGMDYAFGCVPSPSAGYGAPHIRDRAFWVADAASSGQSRTSRGGSAQDQRITQRGLPNGLEHAASDGRLERRTKPSGRGATAGCVYGGYACTERQPTGGQLGQQPQDGGTSRMADDQHEQRPIGSRRSDDTTGRDEEPTASSGLCGDSGPGPTNGLWRDADWLGCTDGKWRPVMPETFPLAHAGAYRNRVGTLRGAGNAINLAQATEWMRAIR